jgi:Zn-finger nucleic acid-binding protein
MRHCPHCGAQTARSDPEKRSRLRCPRCEAAFSAIQVGRYPISHCPHCGGLWVGKEVFQDICTKEEEQEAVLSFQFEPPDGTTNTESKPRRTYVPCPECGKLMNHKNFSGSGIVLDWCREHGSWFDRNELQQIVRFIGEGGLRKAREKEKLKLKEQENRMRMQEFTMASLERRLDSTPGHGMNHGATGESVVDFLFKMFR